MQPVSATCPRCRATIAVTPGTAAQCTHCGFWPVGHTPPTAAAPTMPPPYPMYMPAPQPAASGMSIISLVLGILSITIPYAGVVVGIAAIIVASLALKEIKRNPYNVGGKPFAIAGLATGIAGTVMWAMIALVFLVLFVFVGAFGAGMGDLDDSIRFDTSEDDDTWIVDAHDENITWSQYEIRARGTNILDGDIRYRLNDGEFRDLTRIYTDLSEEGFVQEGDVLEFCTVREGIGFITVSMRQAEEETRTESYEFYDLHVCE